MTSYFYSPSLHTFMVEGLHPNRPIDCVSITYLEYAALLQQQSQGLVITFDSTLMKPVAHAVPARPESDRLERLHQDKTAELNGACEAAITGGFWSSALGQAHQYTSQMDDQLNLTGVILAGRDSLYACRDQHGAKDFRPHTADQLRQVGNDFTQFKLQLLQKASGLKFRLDQALAAADLVALEAVTWESAL